MKTSSLNSIFSNEYHTPFTTITSSAVFNSLYVVITGTVDLKYDGYFYKYDNTKTESWKPLVYNWKMNADILPENPEDDGFSKGISLTISNSDFTDTYHIVYNKDDGTWRCAIILPKKGNYTFTITALLHNKKNIPVIVQKIKAENIVVNSTISAMDAQKIETTFINIQKSKKQRAKFSNLYSSNYITKSIQNTNTVQPANTLWKIVRLKTNIKDANDNYIYKYDIINSGTNKSLLNLLVD